MKHRKSTREQAPRDDKRDQLARDPQLDKGRSPQAQSDELAPRGPGSASADVGMTSDGRKPKSDR